MLLSIILVAIVATAGSSLFSVNPTVYINPWIDTYYRYEKTGGQWVTYNSENNHTTTGLFMPVNCKNNGATTATFNITVSFAGASFSPDTKQPYWQINSTAASFALTLRVGEQQTTDVHFQIDENTDHFSIALSVETGQDNLFVEPVRKANTFFGYKQLYYIWVPEHSVYAPALIE